MLECEACSAADEPCDVGEALMAAETALDSPPCKCNPPGSGEEFCTGHCRV